MPYFASLAPLLQIHESPEFVIVSFLTLARTLVIHDCSIPRNLAVLETAFNVIVWNASSQDTRSIPVETCSVTLVQSVLAEFGDLRAASQAGILPGAVLEMFRMLLLPNLAKILHGPLLPDGLHAMCGTLLELALLSNPSAVCDPLVMQLPQLFVVPQLQHALISCYSVLVQSFPAAVDAGCTWVEAMAATQSSMLAATSDFTPCSKLSSDSAEEVQSVLIREVIGRPAVESMFLVLFAYALRLEAPLESLDDEEDGAKHEWDTPSGNAMLIALHTVLSAPHRDLRAALVTTTGALVHRTVTLCEEAFRRSPVLPQLLECALGCAVCMLKQLQAPKLGQLHGHIRHFVASCNVAHSLPATQLAGRSMLALLLLQLPNTLLLCTSIPAVLNQVESALTGSTSFKLRESDPAMSSHDGPLSVFMLLSLLAEACRPDSQ